MLPKLDKKSLQNFYNHAEIIKDTALQVQKDLGTYGHDIVLPEKPDWIYEELFKQLLPTIEGLLNDHNQQLLAMLYTIDVSEKLIKQEAAKHPDVSLAVIVTELILERELKKVITRHYFRGVQ